MGCMHDGDLAARWDYLARDKSSAAGWIMCWHCGTLLQRLTYAGGRFRGQGRYMTDFLDQICEGNAVKGLEELTLDAQAWQ